LESRVLLTGLPPTVLTQVISFPGGSNGGGRYPDSLVADSAGDLFGTTEEGGINNYGTIFEVPAGTSSILTIGTFADGTEGYSPNGKLVLDGNILYGATTNGGIHSAGTLFSFNITTHTLTSLYSFTGGINGGHPTNGIASDGMGNFYGTTYGGDQQNATVFEYTVSSGAFQTLASLPLNIHIDSGVALDAGTGLVALTNGPIVPGQPVPPVLYATTTQGGVNGEGSIFSFTLGAGATSVHTVASFDATHGNGPLGTLYYVTNLDAAGDTGLIGVTSGGGASSDGAIFDMPLTGANADKIGLLGSFGGSNGGRPNGSLILADSSNLPTDSLLGNTLYGTTSQGGNNSVGAVFKLPNAAPASASFYVPAFTNYPFNDNVGIYPSAGLVLFPDGTLYGTLSSKGKYLNGSLFELSATQPAAAVTHLAFSVLPTSAVAGTFLGATTANPAGGVVVKVLNAAGQLVTSDESEVTLQVATGTGAFTPITVAAVNGVATFTDVLLTQAGTYNLLATDGTARKQSDNLTVKAAAAAALAIVAQPTIGTTTAKLGSIVVDVEDAYGNIVKSDHSTVSLAVASGPGAVKGTTKVTAKSGVATFSALSLAVAGTYTLTATDATLTATTGPITVGLPATHLVFSEVPSEVTTGQAFTIEVTLLDANGNVATTTSGTVKITLGTHPSGGKLFGAVAVTVINGVATFAPTVFKVGNYTLKATDGSFAAVSTLFQASVGATPA
jgi:uncharacterized repeat protein (TIGR03803 family)